MLKFMIYWLSFGLVPRRESTKKFIAGHTLEDERSFDRRMQFYRAHPHH